MAPEAVVGMLDELFSEFDALAEGHGLEKIKTVGDAYVVVGGVPEPMTEAAAAVAEMALDMLDLVAGQPDPSGASLALRIGIDVGPVVAGVIGRQKFTYDLWGDTVNTASRMESHGVPGAIQVTPRAHDRLKHLYEFERREKLEIKGKGSFAPWLLKGRSTASGSVRPGPEVDEHVPV
jgi:class 3 adenylate cyclase